MPLDILWFLALAVLAALCTGGVLAWVNFFHVRRLRGELARATARIARLEGEGREAAPAPAAPPAPEPPPLPRPAEIPAETPAGAGAPPPAPVAPAADRLERWLASRWLVGIGALALALAGVFLVKHSIDRGWLGPAARCLAGGFGGLALMAAGEWLRRRRLLRPPGAPMAVEPAAALTAGGAAALFGSVYAAHALYGLVSAAPAFLLLAGAAASAAALSLVHGPFIAVFGVLGGYLVPALVSTETPSATALFAFLAALNAAALWIIRYRGWRRIAWLALAGAVPWPALWLLSVWQPADTTALGAYLTVSLALFLYVRPVSGAVRPAARAIAPGGWLARVDLLPAAAGILFAALVFALVRVDGYGPVSVAVLGAVCLACMDAGRRRDGRADALGGAALVLVLALFAVYHIEAVTDAAGRALGVEGWRYDLGRRLVPPALEPFLAFGALFAGLLAALGFHNAKDAPRPWLWAGISAAAPVAMLAIAFWRIRAFEVDFSWVAVAVGVAALQVLAAERTVRRAARPDAAPGMDGALAAYALGASGALGLAMAMALEQAWLTAALALQVAVLAGLHDRLRLPGLRLTAFVAAGVTIARLLLNVHLLDYDGGAVPGFGWMLYGYGVPLVSFWWAARRFGAHRRDALVTVLEAGALAFGVMLVSLQIRDWSAGGLDAASFGFAERSLHTAAWLAIAWGLYRRAGGARGGVVGRGWRLIGGAAAVHLVAVQIFIAGPLTSAVDVGDTPILNLLLLAYGLPALLAAAFFRAARGGAAGVDRIVARISGALGLALVFVWLTLEVRRGFHGGVLSAGKDASPAGDAEWYAYSPAWLVYAGVLLALGLRRGHAVLRHASLVLVVLTVAKLFLFDMSALAGLYRVASFLGLGLSLVGIGVLYQRFVFPPSAAPPPPR